MQSGSLGLQISDSSYFFSPSHQVSGFLLPKGGVRVGGGCSQIRNLSFGCILGFAAGFFCLFVCLLACLVWFWFCWGFFVLVLLLFFFTLGTENEFQKTAI